MDKWLPSIVSLIIALVGFGGSLLLVRGQRQKLKAESAQLIVDAAGDLVNDLSGEIKRLREEIIALKLEFKTNMAIVNNRNVALVKGNAILTKQLQDLGKVPDWTDRDAD